MTERDGVSALDDIRFPQKWVHPDQVCPECGSALTWFACEPHDINTMAEEADGTYVFATVLNEGRYVCHNVGGCENAPG
jgi:hypothetical protein